MLCVRAKWVDLLSHASVRSLRIFCHDAKNAEYGDECGAKSFLCACSQFYCIVTFGIDKQRAKQTLKKMHSMLKFARIENLCYASAILSLAGLARQVYRDVLKKYEPVHATVKQHIWACPYKKENGPVLVFEHEHNGEHQTSQFMFEKYSLWGSEQVSSAQVFAKYPVGAELNILVRGERARLVNYGNGKWAFWSSSAASFAVAGYGFAKNRALLVMLGALMSPHLGILQQIKHKLAM